MPQKKMKGLNQIKKQHKFSSKVIFRKLDFNCILFIILHDTFII